MRTYRPSTVLFSTVFFYTILTLSGCASDDPRLVSLSGRAVFPTEFRTTLGEITPVSNAPVQVLDLARTPPEEVATGITDAEGNYQVAVDPTPSVAVIVLGEIRVSGLIDASQGNVQKDFDGVTDVACEAGLTAILDGSITAQELNQGRIDILETAARQVINEGPIDFTNADGSRGAAAVKVREITGDGIRLPTGGGHSQ